MASERHTAFAQSLGLQTGEEPAIPAGKQPEETLAWQYLQAAGDAYAWPQEMAGFQRAAKCGEGDECDLALVKREGAVAWLAFRGSLLQLSHWVGSKGNLYVAKRPLGPEWPGCQDARVHRGFLQAFESLKQGVLEQGLGAVDVVRVTGHSRGGALATLAGLWLAKAHPRVNVEVVAWALPRVGDRHFRKCCAEQANLRLLLVGHRADLVCRSPPFLFEHAVEPLFLDQHPLLYMALSKLSRLAPHQMEQYEKGLRRHVEMQHGRTGVLLQVAQELAEEHFKPVIQSLQEGLTISAQQHTAVLERLDSGFSSVLGAVKEARYEAYHVEVHKAKALLLDLKACPLRGDSDSRIDDLRRTICELLTFAAQEDIPESLRLEMLQSTGQAWLVYSMLLFEAGRMEELSRAREVFKKAAYAPLRHIAKNLHEAHELLEKLPVLQDVESLWAVLALKGCVREETSSLLDNLSSSTMESAVRTFQHQLEGVLGALRKENAHDAIKAGQCCLVQACKDLLQDLEMEEQDQEVALRGLEGADLESLWPRVVITGPTNSGKSTLANAFLGQFVLSCNACPESFLPVFVRARQDDTNEFECRLVGARIQDFASAIGIEASLTADHHFDRAPAAMKWVRKVNQAMRRGMQNYDAESELFQEWRRYCAEWAIVIRFPPETEVARSTPYQLVDLPGNTEVGLVRDFMEAMVQHQAQNASVALLVIGGSDQITLLKQQPELKFLGGNYPCEKVWLVINKIRTAAVKEELETAVQEALEDRGGVTLARLLKEKVYIEGFTILGSQLLRGRALPAEVPEEDSEEWLRCQHIYAGVEGALANFQEMSREWEEVRERADRKLSGSMDKLDNKALVQKIEAVCRRDLAGMAVGSGLNHLRENLLKAARQLEMRVEAASATKEESDMERKRLDQLLNGGHLDKLLKQLRNEMELILRRECRVESTAHLLQELAPLGSRLRLAWEGDAAQYEDKLGTKVVSYLLWNDYSKMSFAVWEEMAGRTVEAFDKTRSTLLDWTRSLYVGGTMPPVFDDLMQLDVPMLKTFKVWLCQFEAAVSWVCLLPLSAYDVIRGVALGLTMTPIAAASVAVLGLLTQQIMWELETWEEETQLPIKVALSSFLECFGARIREDLNAKRIELESAVESAEAGVEELAQHTLLRAHYLQLAGQHVATARNAITGASGEARSRAQGQRSALAERSS